MEYPTFDLSSKTAVVIGGTSGIGRAIAKGLANAGANMVSTGRRADLVQSVSSEIKSMGRRTLAQVCDVTSRESVEELLERDARIRQRRDIGQRRGFYQAYPKR